MQFPGRKDKPIPQAAVRHDSQHFEVRATVAGTFAARMAFPAVHVRLDTTAVSRFHIRDSGSDFQNFDSQFMSRYSRVNEKGHLAEKAADVRPADADSMD